MLERVAWKMVIILFIALVVVQVLLTVPGVRYMLCVVERLEGQPLGGNY